MEMEEKIFINGATYVREDTIKNFESAEKLDGMEYCIVRTYSAGVFAGYVQSREGREAVLRNARRIWEWDGAAELCQLSIYGASKPQNCKFSVTVDRVILTEVIEIIPATEMAKKNIEEVPEWKC